MSLFSSNIVQVVVSGDGDYEYSLDGKDYQDESRFDTVDSGFYTVFVQDKNSGGITQKEISVIDFPKFFTPNGDDTNYTLQIIRTNDDFGDKAIDIFDRYGKLIKQIGTGTIGWDGSMNGELLPSSDYW